MGTRLIVKWSNLFPRLMDMELLLMDKTFRGDSANNLWINLAAQLWKYIFYKRKLLFLKFIKLQFYATHVLLSTFNIHD